MNPGNLAARGRSAFARFYRLTAAAVAILTGVITGSLVTGDSVRGTLVRRVTERLGRTETVVFARNSFLDRAILDDPSFAGARGLLTARGFVSDGGKLIPVTVYGVDCMSIPANGARINRALEKEFAGGVPSDMVLRLPATGMTPSGSLFVTENYTTVLRLAFSGVAETGDGGDFSLKNEQTAAFNIFLDRDCLAAALDVENRVNLILFDRVFTHGELAGAWRPEHSGLKTKAADGVTEVFSDRTFIQGEAVDAILRNCPTTNRLFSYLANSIVCGERSVPYSFVTALDRYAGEALRDGDAVLSDYAAARLGARVGDSVRLSYFVSHDLKTLSERSRAFTVTKIVPLAVLQSDSGLSVDFPGLSNVEKCTDWDSDLPIDMSRIGDEDERYWKLYRNTPKVLAGYGALALDWGNAYGTATALRIDGEAVLRDIPDLKPEMFGISLIRPREAGFEAARNGVDFAGLFLALGVFIVVSAVLLMTVPLSEMFQLRRDETALLESLGYSRRRIAAMFGREATPAILAGSLVGALLGPLYTGVILLLLGGVWRGATQTSGFSLVPDAGTMFTGLIAGTVISMTALLLLLWKEARMGFGTGRKNSTEQCCKTSRPCRVNFAPALLAAILAAAAVLPLLAGDPTMAFVASGALLTAAAAVFGNDFLRRTGGRPAAEMNVSRLVRATIYDRRRQALLSFVTLALGVFIVFSVGLNRQNFADVSQHLAATGGYSLLCETSVPIQHSLDTRRGREKLALADLPPEAMTLQFSRYGADDASCLNLNRVGTPTVLGVDTEVLAGSDFETARSLYGDKAATFAAMRTETDGAIPALVDETVLEWSLMRRLGDTIVYTGDGGRDVVVRLVGTLRNSIFQGNIIVDKRFFAEAWSETAGSELMLVRVDGKNIAATKNLLSQALSDYGVRVVATTDRLKELNGVTDTYLSIFMTLGALGLLLGIMSFVVVVRKNLAARRYEIDLYRTLGFGDGAVRSILYRENVVTPLYALATGVTAAIVGASAGFAGISVALWIATVCFTLLFAICITGFVKLVINVKVLKTES
jgi:putative ABC transport system permease protein